MVLEEEKKPDDKPAVSISNTTAVAADCQCSKEGDKTAVIDTHAIKFANDFEDLIQNYIFVK